MPRSDCPGGPTSLSFAEVRANARLTSSAWPGAALTAARLIEADSTGTNFAAVAATTDALSGKARTSEPTSGAMLAGCALAA